MVGVVRAASSSSRSDRLRIGRGDEYDVALAQANVATLPRHGAQPRPRLRSRRCARSRRSPAAIRPRRSRSRRSSPRCPGRSRSACPRSCSSAVPTSIAAERRVAAAFYRVEEAKAARLPRISLTAAVSSISSELFVLQGTRQPGLERGGASLAPLFIGGALQAQVEVRTAEQKQAFAEYGARRLARLRRGRERARERIRARRIARPILTRAVARQRARARAREHPLPRRRRATCAAVQQQQLALHAARTALLRVQAERLVQRVNLHLALGGSFTQSQ